MIKRITIDGFQSHENTVVDLVNGLNILTGSSDSGKTAVLMGFREIGWLARFVRVFVLRIHGCEVF